MRLPFLKTIFFLLVLKANVSFSGSIDLVGTWLFHTGDHPDWAGIDFIDSTWDFISAPQLWEYAGFPNYDGCAWYRKTIFLPENWRNEKYFKIKKYLLLDLGTIHDVDQTFFNAHQIGTTGVFPPDYQARSFEIRHYQIPDSVIRWGRKNVIAVRVFDHDNNGGGIYSGPLHLRTPLQVDFCQIQTVLNRRDHIYETSEAIIIKTKIKNDAPVELAGKIEWQIFTDTGVLRKTQMQVISVASQEKAELRCQFNSPGSGIYQVKTRLTQDYEIVYESSQVIGCALDQLNMVRTTVRKDFDLFWQRSLDQLNLTPLLPEIQVIDSLSSVARKFFSVRLLSFNHIDIYGNLLLPVSAGKLPVIIYISENGNLPSRLLETYFPDFAIFTVNVRGFGKSRVEINPGFPGYLVWNINNKEKYVCRGAIMDCIRAVDFVSSRSELDTTKIIMLGHSLCGGFALAAAGLDRRIKVVAANTPLLIAFNEAIKRVSISYHEFVHYIVEHPAEKELVFANLSYFELLNFANRVTCPVFLSSNLDSPFAPAKTVALFYKLVQTEKNLSFFLNPGEADNSEIYLKDFTQWLVKIWGINHQNLR